MNGFSSPAAQRVSELLALSQNATPELVARFVEANFTSEYSQYSHISRRIAVWMDWRRRGGLSFDEVVASDSHGMEVIASHSLTDERRVLRVEVERLPPHRISSVLVGRAPLPPQVPPADESAARSIIEYTERLAALDRFSGAVLVARHGRILAQRAWGQANRDFGVLNQLDTRFNIGSINKTWTAIAALQLVERDAFSLTDPIAKFISYPDAPTAARIQIRHLLTHTSGLGCYFTEKYDRTARKYLRNIDDFLLVALPQSLHFPPGSQWKYSNLGMIILGKVIELVSGSSYFDYVTANVLQPAAMTSSGFFELDRVNPNLAVGYYEQWSERGVEKLNNLFEHVVRGGPAGGAYSTVGDMLNFAEAFKSGQLVPPRLVEVMTSPKPELNSPYYGYGFSVHPGRLLYGHSGGFPGLSANLDVFAEPAGWIVVILANDMGMRAPMLKARQLLGLQAPESSSAQACLQTGSLRKI